MKIGDSGVQVKKSLRPLDLPESQLVSFLSPCGTVRLFNQVVTAGHGDDPLVIHLVEHWKLTDGGPVTRQLVGEGCFWDVIFVQKTLEK